MALAVRTGIPASVWATEGEVTVITALELLERADQAARDRR